MTTKYIADTIESILSNNQDLLEIAFKQRAKFEGWLKFEIARAFSRLYPNTKVEYPIAKVCADLFADNCLIELKTPNTNYTCKGVDSKTRPITKNVNDIIDDINKLGELRKISENHCYDLFIAFVMFPIDIDKDEDKNTTSKYMEHVNRIEKHIQEQGLQIIKYERIVTIKSIPALVYVAKV